MPRPAMTEKKLKLAPGRTVPMEDGREWPEGGAMVPVTLYIRRRIADGDLVEAGVSSPTIPKTPVLPAATGATGATGADNNTNDDTASKAKTGGK